MRQRRQEMRQIWCRESGLNPPSGTGLSDLPDLSQYLHNAGDLSQAGIRYGVVLSPVCSYAGGFI